MTMAIESFHDALTGAFSHLVHSADSNRCAVIDPVLGFDFRSGRTDTALADEILAYIVRNSLSVEWILETHMHADHLSAAAYLRNHAGGRIAASERVKEVQVLFAGIYGFSPDYYTAPGLFDYFFGDDEAFEIAGMPARAIYVPGHTPADVAYKIGDDVVFVGDTLFAPDVGTARCDFPGGSATQLYRSAHRLLSLPNETRLYLCHDYPPGDRGIRKFVTVGEQRDLNIHLNLKVPLADFVAMREARDATLAMPNLLLPSMQVNIRAGVFPEPSQDGKRYLKIPLDVI